jgi:hypothetical protein
MRSDSTRLGGELPSSRRRDLVEARPAIVLRRPPLPAQEPALLQAHQARVERPHIELEGAVGDLLQPRRDRVAVRRSQRRQGLQDHEVQRALQNVCLGGTPLAIQMEYRLGSIWLSNASGPCRKISPAGGWAGAEETSGRDVASAVSISPWTDWKKGLVSSEARAARRALAKLWQELPQLGRHEA